MWVNRSTKQTGPAALEVRTSHRHRVDGHLLIRRMALFHKETLRVPQPVSQAVPPSSPELQAASAAPCVCPDTADAMQGARIGP